jgi:hypothetical protein
VTLASYQQCRSLDGWVPIEVGSRSQPGVTYVVLVNPWSDHSENICECKGYSFNGKCAHQKIASQKVCGWTEIGVRAKTQTENQKRLMECPACGGRTMWAFKMLEEGDRIA